MTERSRHIILIFDEITVRSELTYNEKQDLIDGLEDIGFQRSSNLGKQVCVFMIRGLIDNWKCVFNYFVSKNSISAENLKKIILENIKLLDLMGLSVEAIVCDQGSNNRKCFTLLGVSFDKPFFYYNNNKKVFAFYDFVHLIKSLRNLCLHHKLSTPDGIFNFDCVVELFELEKGKVTKMRPKLTEKHVHPNTFDKMRVSFATQVFSRSVASSINTIVECNQYKKSSKAEALSTAKFIEMVDKIFDCMNSCTLIDRNQYKCENKQHSLLLHQRISRIFKKSRNSFK